MALKGSRVAIHWKDSKGNPQTKVYDELNQAEQAKKWLIKQGVSLADIELAIVKEALSEPEPIAK